MWVKVHQTVDTDRFKLSYKLTNDATREKFFAALILLKSAPKPPDSLDLRVLGHPDRGIYSIKIDENTRLTFRNVSGIAVLRYIGTDVTLDTD